LKKAALFAQFTLLTKVALDSSLTLLTRVALEAFFTHLLKFAHDAYSFTPPTKVHLASSFRLLKVSLNTSFNLAIF
jgi:hypothetical protein